MRNLNILIVSSFLFSIISCSGGTNYVGTGNTAQKTVSYEYSAKMGRGIFRRSA
ncbi:MAG: hypothetical protein IJP61_10925 [Treponema sp.]|nr:hypothetical protein [Treponema sp.]